MKKKDVEIGGTYTAKVSGKIARVRITGESRFGGWDALNLDTKKQVRIRGAGRLRQRVDTPKAEATTTVEPVATAPAAEADAQEKPSDATVPNVVEQDAPKASGIEIEVTCRACKRKVAIDEGLRKARCECGQPLMLFRERDGMKVKWVVRKFRHTNPTVMPQARTIEEPPAEEKPKGEREPRKRADGKMGGLDAAAQVLAEAGEPLGCEEMVKRMLEKGLWATDGKTPAATIYAAIIREIAKKGDASRFRKVGRGMFTVAK